MSNALGFKEGVLKTCIVGLPMIMLLFSKYFAVNIPYLDDYDYVLCFLNEFIQADTFLEGVQCVLTDRSNYLFVTFRCLLLLDFALFGEIDFTHIIFVNHLVHLGIIYLCYLLVRQIVQDTTSFFLPIVLLLASPTFMVNGWSSYLTHVLAVFFTLVTILSCLKNNTSILPISIFASLALFSSPIGILAFIVPLPFIGIRSRKALTWLGIFLLNVLIYLTFVWPLGEEILGVVEGTRSLVTYGGNFLLFFGAIFKPVYQDQYIWSILFGLGIFSIISWLTVSNYRSGKTHPLIFSGLLLSLMLAIFITVMRTRFGLGATTSYRYRLYQSLPLVFIYISLIITHRSVLRKHLYTIYFLSVIFLGFRYLYNIDRYQERNRLLRTSLYNLQVTGDVSQLPYRVPTLGSKILSTASLVGVYDYEEVDVDPKIVKNAARAAQLLPLKYVIKKKEDTSNYYKLSGWAWLSNAQLSKSSIYLFVQSGATRYYFETGPMLDSTYFMQRSPSGFTGVIDKRKTPFEWSWARMGMAIVSSDNIVIAESMLP